MRAIFSGPPPNEDEIFVETSLFFRGVSGFFLWAEFFHASHEMIAAMFHIAIGNRCGAEKSRIKVAGFVSTFVMFAANRKALFHGEGALFPTIEFFTLLRSRGTTVPGMAKWALRVYDGSLNPPLP